MAMKKKIAVGLAALTMTALCFGTTAFAAGESYPINGSGNDTTAGANDVTTDGTEGKNQTELELSFKDVTPGEATWSVDIPQKITFEQISATTDPSKLVKELSYSSYIHNGTEADVQDGEKYYTIENLAVKLTDSNKFNMTNVKDPTIIVKDAYKVMDAADKELVVGDTIVTMTEDVKSAVGKVKLDDTKWDGYTAPGKYNSQLTVTISPTVTENTKSTTPAS